MAEDMQEIKRRMKSVKSTERITNAMRLVSAAKLRRAKATFEKTSKYFHYVTNSIAEVFQNSENIPSDYLEGRREIKTTCYILITSCKGFCGSFNINVIKELEKNIRESKTETKIVAVGTKGKEYFERRKYSILSSYLSPAETVTFVETHNISKPIIEMYDAGEIDEVKLVYTSYVNTLVQAVKTVRILPFDVSLAPEIKKVKKEVEYEPSAEGVFNYLLPKYAEILVFSAIVESATCENAARRTAMESATNNAQDMIADLSLYYNRARQAAITNQLIEIVSGSELQK